MFGDKQDELHRRALSVPLEPLRTDWLRRAGVELWVRRDDLIDPHQSGNKFYKLFYNLQLARAQGYSKLLSFGGAWSNHLHALAAAGAAQGMATLGVVRGERPPLLSATLADAERWGMELVFVGRSQYRAGQLPESLLQQSLYLIPEGGGNLAGAAGMAVAGWALEQQLQGDFELCLACGTGASLAGAAAGLQLGRRALGFSVLKGEGGLAAQMDSLYRQLRPEAMPNWRLISGFHGGGYAKKLPAGLMNFWHSFEQETGLLLDPVYTLKLFWGIYTLAQMGYWRRGTRLVAIHSGGLQGRRGFADPHFVDE